MCQKAGQCNRGRTARTSHAWDDKQNYKYLIALANSHGLDHWIPLDGWMNGQIRHECIGVWHSTDDIKYACLLFLNS